MVLKHAHRSVDLVNSIRKIIITKQLIKATEGVLISISGGQDSICLLFLINQLYTQMDLRFSLFWCHHLWQIDSFSLMRQITKISFLFQFDGCFAITSKLVPSEILARNWRHNCSYRICLFYHYSKIILAHSANDKVETILLNLLRGTGTAGLSPLSLKYTNSIANKEHVFSYSVFPMFLFSWSPFYIDLLTLHRINAKKIQKNNRKQAIAIVTNKTFCTTLVSTLSTSFPSSEGVIASDFVDQLYLPLRSNKKGKKETFSDLKNCKTTYPTPKYPISTRSSFFYTTNPKGVSPKYGSLYGKFLQLKYVWKTPCLMLTTQMTTFFAIARNSFGYSEGVIDSSERIRGTLKMTFFPAHSSSYVLWTRGQNQRVYPEGVRQSRQKVPRETAEGFRQSPQEESKKTIQHLHHNCPIFLFSSFKKQIPWISEKLFFRKQKNFFFVDALDFNQMPKQSLSVNFCKHQIFNKDRREKKNKKWFVFVSFTFFKACYTSLQQMQIHQYNKKILSDTIKSSFLQDIFFIDFANTSVTTRYSRDINSFFFWHHQCSKSKGNKLKQLPWKQKNIFILSAYKQLKINVSQDNLLFDFLKPK